MTKEQAVHAFFSQFGLKVYQEDSVPSGDDAPDFPYGTYNLVTDDFYGGDVPLSFSLWYLDSSWLAINAKTEEISRAIGLNGYFMNCNGGAVWFKKGSPFATSSGDESNRLIKRKLINITVEYITDY